MEDSESSASSKKLIYMYGSKIFDIFPVNKSIIPDFELADMIEITYRNLRNKHCKLYTV